MGLWLLPTPLLLVNPYPLLKDLIITTRLQLQGNSEDRSRTQSQGVRRVSLGWSLGLGVCPCVP